MGIKITVIYQTTENELELQGFEVRSCVTTERGKPGPADRRTGLEAFSFIQPGPEPRGRGRVFLPSRAFGAESPAEGRLRAAEGGDPDAPKARPLTRVLLTGTCVNVFTAPIGLFGAIL